MNHKKNKLLTVPEAKKLLSSKYRKALRYSKEQPIKHEYLIGTLSL